MEYQHGGFGRSQAGLVWNSVRRDYSYLSATKKVASLYHNSYQIVLMAKCFSNKRWSVIVAINEDYMGGQYHKLKLRPRRLAQ